MKRCTGCGVGKSTSEFYKHPNGKHGLHPRCKDCLKAYALERRDTAIGRTYNSRYCDSHKDEKRNYNRTYKKTFMGSLRIRFANMKTRCGNKNCLRYKIMAAEVSSVSLDHSMSSQIMCSTFSR